MNLFNKITQLASNGMYQTIQSISSPTDFINHNITSINQLTEYFVPVLTSSQFEEKGVLTPDEFVEAGDLLSFTCRTWSWYGSTGSYIKSFLPQEKQYLLTRGVTQLRRDIRPNLQTKMTEDGEWENCSTQENDEEITPEELYPSSPSYPSSPLQSSLEEKSVYSSLRVILKDDSEIPDIETGLELELELYDEDAIPDSDYRQVIDPEQYISETRTYDLSITYDKFYRTPRIWINGFDHKGIALAPEMILEEISAEHVNKTVTIEQHPYLPIVCVSIHPCHHSTVMKKMIETYKEVNKTILVRDYLFLFLKFISCIIPNLNYDFTFSV